MGMLADTNNLAEDRNPAPGAIQRQLSAILSSPDFEASPRRKKFLEYLVQETLAGRGERLKGATLACEVFGRKADFNSKIDPIVRLEATRLRRDLEHYYLTAGRSDPLHISIPKGSYLPKFSRLAAAPAEGVATAPSMAAVAPAQAPARPRQSLRLVAWTGAAIFVAIAAAQFGWSVNKEMARATPSSIPTLVVTTFEDLGEDRTEGFFASGVTEQIVANLTLFQGLRVFWPQFTPSGTNERVATTRPAAQFVLSGSVASVDRNIRVTARLLDTRSNATIWTKTFDRELVPNEVFALQDEISQHVAASIGNDQGVVALAGRAAAQRKPPNSLSAYECVLRAHYLQRYATTVHEFGSIRACLEHAVKIEPSYADAWAMLSLIYGQESRFGYEARPSLYDATKKSIEAGEIAANLNPRSSIAFTMLAIAYFSANDVTRFKQAARTALRLNPNDPVALVHAGMRYTFLGEWDEALSLTRKAVSLSDDQLMNAHFAFALYHYHQRDYESALGEAQQIHAPMFFWTGLVRAMILGQLGRRGEAAVEVARLLELKPDLRRDFRAFMKPWNIPDAHLAHMIQGLQLAGLQVE
jgi:adenylate cyclase